MKYKYSILMTIYNEEIEWITQAIDSIRKQVYTNFEVIIIIDNKNHIEAISLIKNLNYSNLKYYINEKNIGLALSLNKGIQYCQGEYIIRMDADDIMEKNRILIQDKELSKNKKIDFLGTSAIKINELNEKIDDFEIPLKYEEIREKIPYFNCFIHPSMIIKKSVLEEVGGYRNFPCAQDYDLFYRLLDKGFYGFNLPEKLLKYRVRTTSISIDKMLSQYLMARYIRKLGKERKQRGDDSYSDTIIKSILKIEKKDQEKFKEINQKLIEIRKRNILYKIMTRVLLSIKSKYSLMLLWDMITITIGLTYNKFKKGM